MNTAIVILTCNSQRWLDTCLPSALAQTHPAQVVLADNGSSDATLAEASRRYPHITRLALGRNWGFAEGYNRALQHVNTEWVVLLNPDAQLAPDWLEILLHSAHAEPDVAVWGGKLRLLESAGRTLQSVGARFTEAGTAFEVGFAQPDAGQYDQPVDTASVPGAALLMRRQQFFDLGGFDPAYFAYLEDVDLCWRAWLSGWRVRVEPRAVADHAVGGTAGGRASPFRIRWMQRNRLANMVKHLQTHTLLGLGGLTSALYDGYRVLEFARAGHWAGLRALWQGAWDFWRSLPGLWRARQLWQSRRRLSDHDLKQRGLLVSPLAAFWEYRRLARLAPNT